MNVLKLTLERLIRLIYSVLTASFGNIFSISEKGFVCQAFPLFLNQTPQIFSLLLPFNDYNLIRINFCVLSYTKPHLLWWLNFQFFFHLREKHIQNHAGEQVELLILPYYFIAESYYINLKNIHLLKGEKTIRMKSTGLDQSDETEVVFGIELLPPSLVLSLSVYICKQKKNAMIVNS